MPRARRHDEARRGFCDETRGRDRHGHRFLDRQQHPGGARLAARGQVRHRARREVRRARLPLPGARRATARLGEHGPAQGAALHGSRRRLELHRHGAGHPRRRASSPATSSTSAPASSWAPAAPRRAPSCAPPTSRARRTPRRSARSRCPRACARAPRRRWPPPSRSRASTIRSRRPAPPRRTASATPPS